MDLLRGLSICTGVGGIDIALSEYVRPIAYCEIDRYAQSVLLSRMSEGRLPKAPIWDSLKTLTGGMLPRPIDIIYGGVPCQGHSCAGARKGMEDERSQLVDEVFRLASELQPRFIFLENVTGIINSGGLKHILKEIDKIGYDARWGCLSAYDVGAPHKRERWFLLAYSQGKRNRRNTGKLFIKNETVKRPENEHKEKDIESRGVSEIVANSMFDGSSPTKIGRSLGEIDDQTQTGSNGYSEFEGRPQTLGVGRPTNLANSDQQALQSEYWSMDEASATEGEQERRNVSDSSGSVMADTECVTSGGERGISSNPDGQRREPTTTQRAGIQSGNGQTRSSNFEPCRETMANSVCGGLSSSANKSGKTWTENNASERTCSSVQGWWAVESDVGWLLPDGLSVRLGEKIAAKSMFDLWEDFGKEKIQERFGGFGNFQKEKILQQVLYDSWADEGETLKKCNRQEIDQEEEGILRIVRNFGKTWYSSQESESLRQSGNEFNDTLLFLSYVFAPQNRRPSKKEAEIAVSYMLEAILSVKSMLNPSFTFEEAWKSISSAWKASLILGRWYCEPPIKRTSSKIPDRVNRIKCLGNSVVPLQVKEAFERLMGLSFPDLDIDIYKSKNYSYYTLTDEDE